MKRMSMTGTGMMLGVLLMTSALATPASAEVNINVNIGPPPPVVVHESPTMVYLAEPGVFVAVGVPYDIYFVSGRYYYFHGDHWFWATGYGGPWVHVVHTSLPPGLRKYKVVKLHEYREREYRVYKTQGPAFKGKHFNADPGPHAAKTRNEDHQGNQGPGNRGGGNSGRSASAKGKGKH